jgi:hypothetical protein
MVTFFTKILRFSWNQIVRVNPLPRGASVEEFKKTCHPRNIEVYEVREMSFQEQRTHEDLESFESAKLRSRERTKIWNLEPAKLQSCKRAKIWNLNL